MQIFYFTGTGNTLKAAKDYAKAFPDAILTRISDNNIGYSIEPDEDTVGIFCPVYYGCAPRMVIEFVKRLRFQGTPYFFTVTTCGSSDFAAAAQIRQILKKNGGLVSASFCYSYPANNQTSYAPTSASSAAGINKRNEAEIAKDAGVIRRKEIVPFHAPNPALMSLAKAATNAIRPSSDSGFHTDDKCVGCGICAAVCPANNISMEEHKPKWNHHCERCTACMQVCPKQNIQFQNKSQAWGRYINPDISVEELKILQQV